MNDKNLLLKEINELDKLYSDPKHPENGSESILEKMDFLLENYLEDHPQDTEIWLKRIRLEFNSPWEDYDRIEKYVNSILAYDRNNIQSLLILAYAQKAYRGKINDNLLIHLQAMSNEVVNKELLSMICLAIAWFYLYKNEQEYEKEYEKWLLQSMFHYNKYIKHYVLLGQLYLKRGNLIQAKNIFNLAIANIHNVSKNNDLSSDVTDIDSFFDEFFKGYSYTETRLEEYIKNSGLK